MPFPSSLLGLRYREERGCRPWDLRAPKRGRFLSAIWIYAADVAEYRLTCFFVDRDYRRDGVSAVALRGALDLIAEAGGGVVEGYPYDNQGEKVTASFLYNGTRSLFEQAGFEYERATGKNHCVIRTKIAPT